MADNGLRERLAMEEAAELERGTVPVLIKVGCKIVVPKYGILNNLEQSVLVLTQKSHTNSEMQKVLP
jgi:hypothetical protein